MFLQLWYWFLEPYNQMICLIALAAFIIGLIVGYLLHSRKKGESQTLSGDAAFFRGIHYLLSNDRDQAIEQFTKSVQVNSDTIETYIALGNLYRMKGDIDRAINIRQTIILRPNIDEQTKLRALLDLGLDYRKGGFLNRALDTFLEVLDKEPSNLEALQELEKIYEDLKDWDNAYATRQKIARHTNENHKPILAHHQTELGKTYYNEGEISRAKACFKKAASIHAGCIDAYLHLGDLYFGIKEYKKAIETWKKVIKIDPKYIFLAYKRLEKAYLEMKDLKSVEDFLKECAQFNPDAFTHLALARYLYNEQDFNGALRELEGALKLDPAFWEARKMIGEILLEQDRKDEAIEAYRDLVPQLNFQFMEFQCTNCGFIPADLQWQCPQCRRWDTITFMDFKSFDSISQQQSKALIPGSSGRSSEE